MKKTIIGIILFSLLIASVGAYEYHLYEDFNDPLNASWSMNSLNVFKQDNSTGALRCGDGSKSGSGTATLWFDDGIIDFGIENNINITIGWNPCPFPDYFSSSACKSNNPLAINRFYNPSQRIDTYSNETLVNNSFHPIEWSNGNLDIFEKWDGIHYVSYPIITDYAFLFSKASSQAIKDDVGEYWEAKIVIKTNPNGTRNISGYRNGTLRYNSSSVLQFDETDEGYETLTMLCNGVLTSKYSFDYLQIDIVDSGVTINESLGEIVVYDCNNTVDDDGDGYTDYPDDPSCSSYTDNTETPFDLSQCNDGIDNDLDNYTDYPNDPSCLASNDNDEFPKDQSTEEEDDCLESLNCLIYDSVPYSDNPTLHGFYGTASATETVNFLGGWSIDLKTVDEYGIKEFVILYKNISHINNYNQLEAEIVLAVFDETDFLNTIDGEELIIGFYDYEDNKVFELFINFTIPSDTAYDVQADIWAWDYDTYVYVGQLFTDDSDNGFLRFSFEMSEIINEYTFTWTDILGLHSAPSTYEYDENHDGQIHKFAVGNVLDSDYSQTLLNLVSLTGVDITDLETICPTWDKPFHLVENFNGYMLECGWNSDPNIFFFGKLVMINEIPQYKLYKLLDDTEDEAIYYERNRYSTVKFDYLVYPDSINSYNLNLFLWDLDFTNAFIRMYFRSNGSIFVMEDGEYVNKFNGMILNTSKEVKIIIDLVDDTFNLYYDGSLIEAGISFNDEFLNIEYFNSIYFESFTSHYEINNLRIYESDNIGGELPNVEVPVDIPDETKSWCELFSKETQSCSVDGDCDSGECLVNGKCSKFDFNYCDENGLTRGNMCMVSGMSSCVLTSTGDIILDNFFLFLIALVIMMGLVYLSIMFSRK